ncbi:hypothetical protein THAR02_10707 [Trichoderma harzianum]|uniref:Uncharacterized protein n=1 Tax=Trichoderma harzianum TaxID=5544 RepID=A0A0F9WVM0_TRIHA|nr:hypothetical protein THAR02_10707 [Trichoderma harzianum]
MNNSQKLVFPTSTSTQTTDSKNEGDERKNIVVHLVPSWFSVIKCASLEDLMQDKTEIGMFMRGISEASNGHQIWFVDSMSQRTQEAVDSAMGPKIFQIKGNKYIEIDTKDDIEPIEDGGEIGCDAFQFMLELEKRVLRPKAWIREDIWDIIDRMWKNVTILIKEGNLETGEKKDEKQTEEEYKKVSRKELKDKGGGDEEVEDEKVEDEKVEDEKVEDEKVEDEKVEDEKMEDEKVEDEKVEDEKVEDVEDEEGTKFLRKRTLTEDSEPQESKRSRR